MNIYFVLLSKGLPLFSFFNFNSLIVLVTLTFLEVVLGVDNIVFIALVTNRLEKSAQASARKVGLLLSLVTRILLLSTAYFILKLITPIFSLFNHQFSICDLFFIVGALFLWVKAINEIKNVLVIPKILQPKKISKSFLITILQIMVFDILFSLDSVISAVSITQKYWLMVTAIIITVFIMLFASNIISKYIAKHKRIKMLAVCFLLLIGLMILLRGFGIIIPIIYFYFAIVFSLFVEILNIIEERCEQNKNLSRH